MVFWSRIILAKDTRCPSASKTVSAAALARVSGVGRAEAIVDGAAVCGTASGR